MREERVRRRGLVSGLWEWIRTRISPLARLEAEAEELEQQLHESIMRLDKRHPRRIGYEDYFTSDAWRKHLDDPPARRPQECPDCLYSWFPRGHSRSARCPKCRAKLDSEHDD